MKFFNLLDMTKKEDVNRYMELIKSQKSSMSDEEKNRFWQLEGLAIGLECRGEKSAAHIIRLALKDLEKLYGERENNG